MSIGIGPDDFIEETPEELTEKQMAELSVVWPAAFEACSSLKLMLHDNVIKKDSEFMCMNLFDLVRIHLGIEKDLGPEEDEEEE